MRFKIITLLFFISSTTLYAQLSKMGKPYLEVQGSYFGFGDLYLRQAGAVTSWPLWGPIKVGAEGHWGGTFGQEYEEFHKRDFAYAGLWTGATYNPKHLVIGARLQTGPEWVLTQHGTATANGLNTEMIDNRVRIFFGLQAHYGIALFDQRLFILTHFQLLNLNSDPPKSDTGEVPFIENVSRYKVQRPISFSIGWNFGGTIRQ
ncbi:MAG TPA: hypothetical protein DCE41_09885 [Cytophagales bacterium]|nr:hypothetical protein [Cytophagales bacterium]HAA22208.1 hypothetical protein [Cytophagales bacterium]HAP63007.1 hypothetical protein [Cytophagales bacterium]